MQEPASEKLARWGLTGIKLWLVILAIGLILAFSCCCLLLIVTGGTIGTVFTGLTELLNSY
jgi:hypothetical protein